MKHREIHLRLNIPQPEIRFHWRGWLPNRGNVIFTVAMIAPLVLPQSVGTMPLERP